MEIDLERQYMLQKIHERSVERIKEYQKTATQEMAEKLGKTYARYWWVQPEITAAMVLNGLDDMMPEIAKTSAKEMMQSGRTPATFTPNYQARYGMSVAV